jgi:hypothetical protein
LTLPADPFAKTGYAVVRSAIPDDQRQFLFNYVLTICGGVASCAGDSQIPGTPFAYGDFAAEALLKTAQPAVENQVGLALYPTYSYLRLYKHGDRLKKHVDRPACEISATLCLGYTADSPWPIWLDHSGQAVPITLLAGDMLIYRGIDVPHWREAYTGDRLAQVFLHYVDRDGPHREWKFDKRERLGSSKGGGYDQTGLGTNRPDP